MIEKKCNSFGFLISFMIYFSVSVVGIDLQIYSESNRYEKGCHETQVCFCAVFQILQWFSVLKMTFEKKSDGCVWKAAIAIISILAFFRPYKENSDSVDCLTINRKSYNFLIIFILRDV